MTPKLTVPNWLKILCPRCRSKDTYSRKQKTNRRCRRCGLEFIVKERKGGRIEIHW